MSNVDSGKLFEEIVGLVLKKTYPNYNFQHTEYYHDGGKDYYATYEGQSVWAEAKCHQRHLELSRIAGTFVMADIYKINCIIIFSRERLTSGAMINLAKYCEKHGITLLVRDSVDIKESIPIYGKFDFNEIVSDMLTFGNYNENELKALLQKLDYNGKTADNILQNIAKLFLKVTKKDEFYYKLLAYAIFNNSVDVDLPALKRSLKVISSDYFKQVNCGTPVHIDDELKAFDVFSNEIVLHNDNLTASQNVQIKFNKSTTQYRLLNGNIFEATLLPGQCLSKKFYFKVLNDQADISLPIATIHSNNRKIKFESANHERTKIACQVVGETPYLGKDNEKLSNCCNALINTERHFQPIVVYGDSGVGKSRFLQELYSSRLQQGNKSYLIDGDRLYNSVADFLRALLCSYYDFDIELIADSKIKQIKPYRNRTFNKLSNVVVSVLTDSKRVDINDIRNWLVFFLKEKPTSLFIDNCQSLNDEILSLLNSVINDLQACHCRSEIIFCFNNDLFLTDSGAGRFFNYLTNCIGDNTFKIEVLGFERNDAETYLQECLAPNRQRNDLGDLCKKIIDKVYPIQASGKIKPLLLKQIILYLYQRNIIGFLNNTVSILDFVGLENAADYLPADLHSILQKRFKLLLDECEGQKEQLFDLMRSVLIFGELPEMIVNLIDGIAPSTLKRCIKLGFLRYTTNNAIIFEHQLIGKSVLLTVDDLPFTDMPIIHSINLRETTAKNFLFASLPNRYFTELFLLRERFYKITCEEFNQNLKSISLKTISELLIPHAVYRIGSYINKFNEHIQPEIKIETLQRLIDVSQNRLGVSRTQYYFGGIIDFQMAHYNYNQSSACKFIELLKTYQYQLPNSMKEDFLSSNLKIAESLFCKDCYKKELKDYRIWHCWASGKHYLNVYDYKKAKGIIIEGIRLAQESKNNHRIAELCILLGDMYACLDDKESTIKCWEGAVQNFNSTGIYDVVLSKIYEGNIALIKNDYKTAKQIYEFVRYMYEDEGCYTFLKCVINDYMCNYLIINFVNENVYSESADKDIKNVLNRFSSLAMTYQEKTYLHVAHKSMTYYKYLLENFSNIREEYKSNHDVHFLEILCNELLANCDRDNFKFYYFYPVFKQIAETAGYNEETFRYLVNSVPAYYKEMFTEISQKKIPETAPRLLKGIFTDKNKKINLFHYSYYWQ